MNVFSEDQLITRGYVKDAGGNWKKAEPGAADLGRSTGREGSNATTGTKSPPVAAEAVYGRASVMDGEGDKRNKLERAFSEYLEARKAEGKIATYEFEAITFVLAPRTRYTPDFFVMLPDGRIEFYETKGFMRDDAAVKLKVAAAKFSMFRFYLVKRACGKWKITEVKR